MSARRDLYAAVMDGGYHSPARSDRASALLDAYRAEVLREAAGLIEGWQNDADDAAAAHHGGLTATETGAHMAVRRMARRLRETAGGAA